MQCTPYLVIHCTTLYSVVQLYYLSIFVAKIAMLTILNIYIYIYIYIYTYICLTYNNLIVHFTILKITIYKLLINLDVQL